MKRLPSLLWPWPALVLGLLLLRAAQWLAGGAADAGGQSASLALLADDLRVLVRALPLWCLLTLPTLALPTPWRVGLLGALAAGLLLVQLGLDVYASVAGVPLGADVWAYSWSELRTTLAGVQLSVPAPWWLALLAGLVLLGWLAWRQWPRPVRTAEAEAGAEPHARAWTGGLALGVLALCLLGSVALPRPGAAAVPVQAQPQPVNTLGFWVVDVLAQQRTAAAAGAQVAGAQVVDSAFPFEHAETTPDTLGPLLALDAQTPPHLVVVVVEGLGRSFSGPGARLGSFTPMLDALAQKSLYWDNFVATQGRTFAVLPSVLASLPFGPYGEQAIAHDSLPSVLKAQGYSLRYFSGSNLAFDHQGAFLAQSGVQSFWSERDFAPATPKASEWGYADGELMAALAQSPVPAQPSLTVVQTMSMHTPFNFPGIAAYRQKVLARLGELGIQGAQRAAVLQQQDIYASILYTDEVLGRWVAQAAQQPAWRNTVWLITGDHRLPEIPMASRLERYHVPLIVYSPMLRAPQRIQAVSSHFDIAPALLALLSHRYGWATPQRVHWMGAGLDVHPHWRNLHRLPLKQTKTELSDYISGEYYLAQDQLYSLQSGLQTTPEAQPELAQSLRAELAQLRGHLADLADLAQGHALVDAAHRAPPQAYSEAGRTLQPERRARQVQGVVVSEAQGQFDAQGRLQAQGVFSLQGQASAPVFVPLLVLSDAQGRQLAEASGPAMRLQPGQAQPVALGLPPLDLPKGRYFLSLIVSHPDTGRSIGRGQYHVDVQR